MKSILTLFVFCLPILLYAHGAAYADMLTVGSTIQDVMADKCLSITENALEIKVVSDDDCISSTDDPTTKVQVQIYPNPSADYFIIQVNKSDMISIQIYNTTGHMIYQKADDLNQKISISTQDIEDGIYYLKINLKKIAIDKKIVIMH